MVIFCKYFQYLKLFDDWWLSIHPPVVSLFICDDRNIADQLGTNPSQCTSDTVLTQSLLLLALMGMFEDEEVVPRRIFGNPEGKLVGLCWFGVNQLNSLLLHIQPLWRHRNKQTQCQNSGCGRTLTTGFWTWKTSNVQIKCREMLFCVFHSTVMS